MGINQDSTIRTPYHKQVITIVLKAVTQKKLRRLHCMECGWPIADISDKVLVVFDGETAIDTLEPDNHGVVELHCRRHQCKQYYRLEFAK
jgi:hypothetical protein